MRTRIVLATFALALTIGQVSLPAQEMPQLQIANWPAPAFWDPANAPSEGIRTERALSVSSSSPVPFIPVTPCRVVDTRLSGGAFAAGETRTFAMAGGPLPCVTGFPGVLAAVSLNITVSQTAGTGFVTGYPTGASLPVVATLTWIGANQTLSNAAVIPIGNSYSINIYASQATHVILDINGYYAAAAAGTYNTLLGVNAGNSTMTGDYNTAIGYALTSNTTGSNNIGIGFFALLENATGISNTAIGREALRFNHGSNNVAIGAGALFSNTSGVGNTALGLSAGSNLTTGSNNIDIGNAGVAGESAIIRIGDQAVHTTTYIAGIFASFPLGGGSAVFANSNGELSTNSSAGRFKEDIEEIGEASEGLMRLRPVAFKYKPEFDPTGLKQYGLIAEEVAQVYPELVLCDRDGKPFTVQYHLVNVLLLNEVQKQHRTVEAQEEKIESQRTEIEELKARQRREIEGLKAELAKLEARLPAEARPLRVN